MVTKGELIRFIGAIAAIIISYATDINVFVMVFIVWMILRK